MFSGTADHRDGKLVGVRHAHDRRHLAQVEREPDLGDDAVIAVAREGEALRRRARLAR
jgi:hypothetical protein